MHTVVIPARNEAATIGEVLDGLRGASVIVVDDASTDETGAIAAARGAVRITLPQSRGYGPALRIGIAAALAERGPIVTMDADGQHDPSRLPALLAALERADVAIGSRAAGPEGWARRAGAVAFSLALLAATRQRLRDVVSGFKAFRPEAARALLEIDTHDLHAEALLGLMRRGFRVVEVPVPSRPRRQGESMYTFRTGAAYIWKTARRMAMAMQPAGRYSE